MTTAKLRAGAGAALGVLLLLAAPGRGADAEAVRQAIDRGVAALKHLQQQDGHWTHEHCGATALAGLTLLECGVPADDPGIQRAAAALRDDSVTLTHTYSLALTILFLDRLGDANDVPLIESLTVRLLAGQTTTGGWTYDCPSISDAEVRRLRATLTARGDGGGKPLPLPDGGMRRQPKDLAPEIQQQLDRIGRQAPVQEAAAATPADNSNTQFVILALWAARRQGLPVEKALARVEARFRASQNPDGGWTYVGGGFNSPSQPAMTCAGLLGLAAAHGIAAEAKQGAREPGKDPSVKAGLLAVGSVIDGPPGPRPNGVPRVADQPVLGRGVNGKGYYFLWSLERVAVAYGLDTIGNKDWYAWGSDILLANQGKDGQWRGEYGEGGVDTCFALLFLRRANLAKDLTAVLKGKVQDPDTRELKAGGVGGAEVQKKNGLQPAFSRDDKTPTKPGPAPASAESARLADELVGAQGAKQEQVLDKLRDSKGAVHTDALAAAIPKLTGPIKAKAREALADRMARMTATTLKDKLKDDDLEVRRAAALACAMKEEKEHIPRLIELLEDPETPVARAAYAALKSMTGEDFGPAAEASRAEVKKSAAAWKAWWAKRGGK